MFIITEPQNLSIINHPYITGRRPAWHLLLAQFLQIFKMYLQIKSAKCLSQDYRSVKGRHFLEEGIKARPQLLLTKPNWPCCYFIETKMLSAAARSM